MNLKIQKQEIGLLVKVQEKSLLFQKRMIKEQKQIISFYDLKSGVFKNQIELDNSKSINLLIEDKTIYLLNNIVLTLLNLENFEVINKKGNIDFYTKDYMLSKEKMKNPKNQVAANFDIFTYSNNEKIATLDGHLFSRFYGFKDYLLEATYSFKPLLLTCYSTIEWDKIWTIDLTELVEGKHFFTKKPIFGSIKAILNIKDILILTLSVGSHSLVAVELKKGKLLWKSNSYSGHLSIFNEELYEFNNTDYILKRINVLDGTCEELCKLIGKKKHYYPFEGHFQIHKYTFSYSPDGGKKIVFFDMNTGKLVLEFKPKLPRSPNIFIFRYLIFEREIFVNDIEGNCYVYELDQSIEL